MPLLPACYYCGCIADTVDHVTPQTVVERRESEWDAVTTMRRETVPACRECNSLLGSRVWPTLGLRKRALKDILRRRYAHYLRIPPWTQGELEELGPNLRRDVEAGLRIQALTRERLSW